MKEAKVTVSAPKFCVYKDKTTNVCKKLHVDDWAFICKDATTFPPECPLHDVSDKDALTEGIEQMKQYCSKRLAAGEYCDGTCKLYEYCSIEVRDWI